MTVVVLVLAGLLALALVAAILAAVGADGAGARRLLALGAAALSALAALAGVLHLIGMGMGPDRLALPVGPPGFAARLRLDDLSALFVAMVGLAGLSASLHEAGAGRTGVGRAVESPGERRLPLIYPLFLFAMLLTPVADDLVTLLFGWELMAAASWLLVLTDDARAEVRRAGFVYLVMAGLGGLALIVGVGVLAGGALRAGGITFDAIRAHPVAPGLASLAFALVVLGAGSKAGLVPLHVWLPLAHPAAPAPVSALMSGAMTKIAVYVLARTLFDLAGPPPWWWGAVLLAAGCITAVAGVLYAVLERELKAVLAYSTVENIGLIAAGLGLALLFRAVGLPAASALALTAALLHAFNHSLMKTLLFLGAGSVADATGEHALDRLGGLAHRMPVTAMLVLIGCLAIAALPPLNGFVSEWLSFQALVAAATQPLWGLRIAAAVAAGVLALAAALAACAFTRLYGMAFLGRPLSQGSAAAVEAGATARAALALPAGLSVLVGVLPGLALALVAPSVHALTGVAGIAGAGFLWFGTPAAGYSGLAVALAVVALTLLAAGLIHRRSDRAVRDAPVWACGLPDPGAAAQVSPDGLAQPLRRVFGARIFSAREEIAMAPPGDTAPARLSVSQSDPAWTRLAGPAARLVTRTVVRVDAVRTLTIRRHLALMAATLVVLLVLVALIQ